MERSFHGDTQEPPHPDASRELWARFYASRGWPVLPLHTVNGGACSCGDPNCISPGKHPRSAHGVKDASVDLQQIRRSWEQWPEADIGLATGAISGIVAFDIDSKNGGEASYAQLQQEAPDAFADLLKVRIGSEGTQLWFQHPGGHLTSRSNIRPGIDFRGDEGYVVAPPSRHASGGRYRFASNSGLLPPPLPQALHDLIAGGARARAKSGPEDQSSGPGPEHKPQTISAAELADKHIRPLVWVVGGLLPEGLVILAAKPKMGKSMLALGLAIDVASGELALGNLPVTQGSVLYLALEDGELRLKDRLEHQLAGKKAPPNLDFKIESPRMDQGGLAQVVDWLGDHPDAKLVIIDTLARFQAPPKRGNSVYLEDYGIAAALKQLADQHHIALLVIHHLRKDPGVDPLDEVSGSTGITGAADTILIMKRPRTNQFEARIFITGRDVEECELALQSDPASKRWSSGGPADGVDISAQRKAILDLLSREGRPMGPSEVASMLGRDTNVVKQLTFKMAKDGQLINRGGGLYEPSNRDNQ
jgi:Bifunctional DNA primase/polymerase, N-terminal/AAA domain